MENQAQRDEFAGVTPEMREFLGGVLGEIMAVVGARKASLFLYSRSGELALAAGSAETHEHPLISVPLRMGDKPLGLITLSDKEGGEGFNGQDMMFASALAAYACVITSHIGIEESLRREKERLEEQKEIFARYTSVGKLAAGIVHEINNPLDGIIRFTNMLLNLQETESLPRGYLLEIKSGLAKIESVTRSLLQFSHHVSRKSMIIRNYVDIPKLIEEALISCEAKRRTDITIRRDIRVRRRLLDLGLSQVFISVIQNALDAMPQGGVLDISAELDGGYVLVSFRDSGTGIALASQEKIFDPFYTEKCDSNRPGLGLSKCREIVGRYNGVVDVKSSPGNGSRFDIRIPGKFLEHDQD